MSRMRRHVGGQAGVVHRDDGLGARRDRRLDRVRVDVQRGRVDVDQLHVGAEVAHHLGGGGEGVRGGDDLVAGADAQRLERQVQPGGGRVDGERSAAPASPRKAAKSSSKRLAFGPVVTQPERSVSTTSAISSSPMSGSAKGRNGGDGAVIDTEPSFQDDQLLLLRAGNGRHGQ